MLTWNWDLAWFLLTIWITWIKEGEGDGLRHVCNKLSVVVGLLHFISKCDLVIVTRFWGTR
jgi:hypothetical protein